MLKLFGTVSLKAWSPLFFKKHFVSELFDSRSYLFGFEGVLLEWEEGLWGQISSLKKELNIKKEQQDRISYFLSDSPFRKEIFASL